MTHCLGVPQIVQTADSMRPQIGIIPATPQTPAYSTEAQVGVKGVSKEPTFFMEDPVEETEVFESEGRVQSEKNSKIKHKCLLE